MTRKELIALASAEMERAIGRVDFSSGGPADFAHGVTVTKIICDALFPYVIDNGAIKIEGISVGLALSAGIHGLQSTDRAAFRQLLADIALDLPNFREELKTRWHAYKIERGELRKGGMTDAERFVGQGFQGFE